MCTVLTANTFVGLQKKPINSEDSLDWLQKSYGYQVATSWFNQSCNLRRQGIDPKPSKKFQASKFPTRVKKRWAPVDFADFPLEMEWLGPFWATLWPKMHGFPSASREFMTQIRGSFQIDPRSLWSDAILRESHSDWGFCWLNTGTFKGVQNGS